jgi:hypothetical protein
VALTWGRTPRAETIDNEAAPAAPLLWEITAEWNREMADPDSFLNLPPPGSEVARNWWRLIFKVGI